MSGLAYSATTSSGSRKTGIEPTSPWGLQSHRP